jgi:hypothetical protein
VPSPRKPNRISVLVISRPLGKSPLATRING